MSPSVNRPRLFHAVVSLRCRHVCRLWKKILMELGQKPEKEQKGEQINTQNEPFFSDEDDMTGLHDNSARMVLARA